MTRAYKFAIIYFSIFSLLLLISSMMIFDLKIGFSVEAVLNYYRGDELLFIPQKTYLGILKITLPHIFAFGLLAMVTLHFLVFTSHKDTRRLRVLIYAIYGLGFLEIFTPYMILGGFDSFAYLKLISFFLFEALILYLLWLIVFDILQ